MAASTVVRCDEVGRAALDGLLVAWLGEKGVGQVLSTLALQQQQFSAADAMHIAAEPAPAAAAPVKSPGCSVGGANSDGAAASPRKKRLEVDTSDSSSRAPTDTVTAPSTPSSPLPPALPLLWRSGGANGEGAASLPDFVANTFAAHPEGLTLPQLAPLTAEACGFPGYLNGVLFRRLAAGAHSCDCSTDSSATGGEGEQSDARVSLEAFSSYWHTELTPFEPVERLFRLLKRPGASYLAPADLEPAVYGLLEVHPALAFLRKHAVFQAKYVTTIVARIYYTINLGDTGRITLRELRRGELLEALHAVDGDQDINQETRFFSYEHFYVLYCRFFELDLMGSGRIAKEDLLKYGNSALSAAIVDRIFEVGARAFGRPAEPSTMSYEDFVYFMLSAEDPSSDRALRYWFACVDLDGDGRLSTMEMRAFYAEQMCRLENRGHTPPPYHDMVCQVWDSLLLPPGHGGLTLRDLLSAESRGVPADARGALFDSLFSLHRFLVLERRDPFAERERRADRFRSDWERFACHDYVHLAAQAQ